MTETPGPLSAGVAERVRPPVATLLGSPRAVSHLAAAIPPGPVTCYQLDLYEAGQLRQELDQRRPDAEVVTAADAWDLPGRFRTVLFPAQQGGERSLKLDMIEQSFHLLAEGGTLIVTSPYEKDQFFPTALKKVYGRVHAPRCDDQMVFWCQRHGDRPRRRHQVSFHARVGDGPSLSFLSRPGTFSYGRFDHGARALVETMEIEPGDHVLDLGCGCGTNGVFAGKRSGPDGSVTFVDSNVRAVALAEHNAQANGLTSFDAMACCRAEGLPEGGFDVVLANPPYFAQDAIAQLFIERSRVLLRPGGRFYLVTKRPDQVGPLVADVFGPTRPVERRGYIVLCVDRHHSP